MEFGFVLGEFIALPGLCWVFALVFSFAWEDFIPLLGLFRIKFVSGRCALALCFFSAWSFDGLASRNLSLFGGVVSVVTRDRALGGAVRAVRVDEGLVVFDPTPGRIPM